jgi:hypothetical protein
MILEMCWGRLWTLSFGLSQFDGHNSWLVYEVDLDTLRVALHLEAGPIRCGRGLKTSLVIGQKAQIGPNPLHLEAGPIRCGRGLKSSLVIGQKAQIGPNPLHLEAGPIWWYDFYIQKMYVMTQPELVESGAPKMEGQFLA